MTEIQAKKDHAKVKLSHGLFYLIIYPALSGLSDQSAVKQVSAAQ